MMLAENFGLSTLKSLSKKAISPENYIKAINRAKARNLASKMDALDINSNPFHLIKASLNEFTHNFTKIVSGQNPSLSAIMRHIVERSGKKLRPSITLLLSKALQNCSPTRSEKVARTADLADTNGLDYRGVFERQKRLSEIVELVHTGSILHDDVIDEADSRRGGESVRKRYGNKVAILGGDYFLAKASISLAILGDNEVIKLISSSIEDLVNGELIRIEIGDGFDLETLLNTYCHKNFLKTASLIANSCKSVAVLKGCDDETVENAFRYGKNLGLSFQIMDDVLDVAPEYTDIGKPKNADLKGGLLTAPVLYAANEFKEIREIARRNFSLNGDIEKVAENLKNGKAISQSRDLAKSFALKAVENALRFPLSEFRDALISVAKFNLDRTK